MKKAILILLFNLAILNLIGAAAAQPKAFMPQDALIKGRATHNHKIYKSFDERLVVSHLDGKTLWEPTLASFFTGRAKYPEEVWVTSGRHYLTVLYSNMNSFASQELWLDAEAGKTYQLRQELTGYTIKIWIEETDTGRVVGGIPGGEPKPSSEQTPDPAA